MPKQRKPKSTQGCGCIKLVNEALAEKGDKCRVYTAIGIDTKTNTADTSGPFVAMIREKSGNPARSSLLCNYCPFCGTRLLDEKGNRVL